MTRHAVADVVVVGAGPAGAATALLLARAGADVVLLDRALFPRPKPCGDCLSAGATGLLWQFGVLAAVEAASPAHLGGWRIHAPSGRSFVGRFERGDGRGNALALSRERLDTILLSAAERAGARLIQGAHVTDVIRDGPAVRGVEGRASDGAALEVRGRLVVGADGLRSVVARRLGLIQRGPRLRKVSLTAHVRGLGRADLGEMHLAPGACLGLAPVQDGPEPLWNVTLVVDSRRHGRQVAADRRGLMGSAARWFPALRGRLDGLRFGAHGDGAPLASGPFDWAVVRTVVPGAALVGDAAGYYDPFTGQGIYQALASALLLADDAGRALRREAAPLLTGYARQRRHLLAGARRLQRLIEAVIARPALAEFAIERLRRAPAVADTLIQVTGDLAPAHTLLDPRLLLHLLAGREAA